MKLSALLFVVVCTYSQVSAQSPARIQEEVWQRELQYWKYVESNDIPGYLTLWHNSVIGYPGTDTLTRNKISHWITDSHNKKDQRYEFKI